MALADTLHLGEAAAHLGPKPTVGIISHRRPRSVPGGGARGAFQPQGRPDPSRSRDLCPSTLRTGDVDNLVKCANERSKPGLGRSVWASYLPSRPISWPRCSAYSLGGSPSYARRLTEDQTLRLLDELTEGSLGAVVLALPTSSQPVVEVPLYWEPFFLLVPPEHPLAASTGLDLAVLRYLHLLLLEEGHCLAGQALGVCRQVGAATDHPARPRRLRLFAQLVPAGLGANLLPATALPVETRKGKLAVARFRAPALVESPPERVVPDRLRTVEPMPSVARRLVRR